MAEDIKTERPDLTQQPVLQIGGTPDLEYPIRILKRFLRNEDRQDRVKFLVAAIRVLEKAHFSND